MSTGLWILVGCWLLVVAIIVVANHIVSQRHTAFVTRCRRCGKLRFESFPYWRNEPVPRGVTISDTWCPPCVAAIERELRARRQRMLAELDPDLDMSRGPE